MSPACGRKFQRLVDRAFVRELPARQRRQLREHLVTCDACRGRWERLAIVDRQLGGPTLDDATLDRIVDSVIPAARPRKAWWVAGALGAVATAALVIVLVRPAARDSELTPRGTPTMGRTPGVRLFCVAGDADHVRGEVRLVSSGPAPELRCTIDDDLQLAYTTPDREGLTMVAFARLDSTMIHYAPPTETGSSLPLRADKVDELVDWSTPLSAAHAPGHYDVIVRFFEGAVPSRDAIDGRISPLVELRARVEITDRGGVDDVR